MTQKRVHTTRRTAPSPSPSTDAPELGDHAVRFDPADASIESHLNTGVELVRSGDDDDAMECFQRVIHLRPDLPEGHVHLAGIYRRRGMLAEAEDHLRRALECHPDHSAALNDLGVLLSESGRFDQAADALVRAIRVDPGSAEMLNNLGTICHRVGEFGVAESLFRRCLQIAPDFAGALVNLGSVYARLDLLEKAADCYGKAANIDPRQAVAWKNLGNVLADMHKTDEAIKCYELALAAQPDFPEARFDRALACLQAADFDRGWREYDERFAAGAAKSRHTTLPLWDGTDIEARRILITSEQGLGDQIMFATCVPAFAPWAVRCGLECDARLASLFRRSFPETEVFAHTDGDLSEQFDARIPIGSLPQYIRPDRPFTPRVPEYLRADPDLKTKWRARLDALPPGIKVGISWKGGDESLVRKRRSIPLNLFNELLATPHTVFVNLQHGDVGEELAEAPVCPHAWPDLDLYSDLDDLAALISELDLVISVDNSIVHLAGASNRPVWNLLPRTADWRWMRSGERIYWYPSMRLFRQRARGEWGPVLEEVTQALATLARH